jgi:hypothetical protein
VSDTDPDEFMFSLKEDNSEYHNRSSYIHANKDSLPEVAKGRTEPQNTECPWSPATKLEDMKVFRVLCGVAGIDIEKELRRVQGESLGG